MSYKKDIDRLRRQQDRLRFNLTQISHDIGLMPPDLGDLFAEHHRTTRELMQLEMEIYVLQPTWRKWLGVPY